MELSRHGPEGALPPQESESCLLWILAHFESTAPHLQSHQVMLKQKTRTKSSF